MQMVYHCWQCETCEWTQDVFFNAEASLCVVGAILVVSIYILVIFLDWSWFECFALLYFSYFGSCPSVQMNLCVVMFFFWWFGSLISSRPNQLLSTNRILLLIFSWTCFSKLLLFYFSLYTFFLAIKLPSVYYLLSDLSYVAFSDTWRYCKVRKF